MVDDSREICHNCRYVKLFGSVMNIGNKQHHCTRYPPVPLLIPSSKGAVLNCTFPAVQSTMSCGEYRSKETDDE